MFASVVAAPGLDGVAHRLDDDVLDGGEGTLGSPSNMGAVGPSPARESSPPPEEVPAVHLNRVQALEGELHALEAHAHLAKTGMNSSALLLWLLRSFSGLVTMSMPIRTLRSHRASLAASLSFERCASACVSGDHPGAEHLALGRVRSPRARGYGVVERLLERVHDGPPLA